MLNVNKAMRTVRAKVAFGDGRIPIMLGGIGHRELSNKEKLVELVAAECEGLKNRYPNSPFVLLSALAEGADRLIAFHVMRCLPADLIAVLPMPQDEYETDFTSEESRDGFSTLLDMARCVLIAPMPKDDRSWMSPGRTRDEQYARASAIIADHSQILFAIWDGQPPRGQGGTGDTVAWFDRGFAPAAHSLYGGQISPLDPPEPGLRIGINPTTLKVQRVQNPHASLPVDARRSNIISILSRTERFNRDVLCHRRLLKKDLAAMANSRLSIADGVFVAGDLLSGYYARIGRYDNGLIYILAVFAALAFAFVNAYPKAVFIYLMITGLMLALFWRVKSSSIDERLLEYRALAEPLRVLHFWREAGVGRSVWLSYLARHDGVVHWLRHATRTVEFCQDCFTPPRKASAADIEIVKEKWVDFQHDWFLDGRLPRLERRRNILRWAGRLAIGASFLVSLTIFLCTLLPAEPFRGIFQFSPSPHATLWTELVKPYGDTWQAVLAVLAAGGLAARGYARRCGDAELAKQYASQRRIFETASDMLNVAGKPGAEWTVEQVLTELGEQALQEQAEFVWLRHERPFEMPQ